LLIAGVWTLRSTVFTTDPLIVEVVAVERGRVEETVTNSRAGTVEARQRAKLSPEIGGTVVEIPFREGERVERGDLLLRLEDSLQRARLEVAQRELEAVASESHRACLAAERSARERQRMAQLTADGIVSTDRLDAFESAAETNAAACQAATSQEGRARAAVGLARAELEKTRIRAPFDGLVAEVRTEIGEYATPAPPAVPVPPVLDVLDPATIYVSAPMDEVDAARLRPGLPARVTVDSHRGEEFPGKVTRVARYVLDVEEQNRTLEIEVELEDAAVAETLLPGTSADAEVVLASREDVLRVPASCLLEGSRVLLLEDGTLRDVEVEVGLRNWAWAEIVSGLDDGALVVTSIDRAEVRPGVAAVAAGDPRP
ncbi:MAG: efflux RND transporter periplasmic adaptor subunit, partial [Thermoanaerobaculia bacterium]